MKTLRHGLGITQEELAWRADMHRTYIADIERGGRNLTLRSIAALAEALQAPIAALVPAGNERPNAALQLIEILLIEDSAADAALAVQSLKNAHASNRIHVAHDGAEALDYLLGTGPHAKKPAALPGIIILDLQLPNMSGVEVLRRIRAAKRTQKIPVLVLTSSRHDRNIPECERLGAESYIIKPLSFASFSRAAMKEQFSWALVRPA